MKVFVLVSRIPWPLEKGDKLRAWHQVRELSQEHEVMLCCLSDRAPHPEAMKQLKTICSEVVFVPLHRLNIALRLVRAVFSNRPFQVHYFYQRAAARMVEQHIAHFKPAHIYCQLVRCSEYVKHIHHIPKTLDYMDAFSKGMERLALQSPRLMRSLRMAEAKRLLRYENLIFDYFNHHTIISNQDRDLIYHPNRKSIAVVPNGVDTAYFHPDHRRAANPTIVFTGNMSYPPNIDSAEQLAQTILPLVRKQLPQTQLILAGADPHARVEALAQHEGVEVTGWVEDIRDAYRRGWVFAAPLRIGTGLQNKLLEAMSMALPCVTTKMANNALGAPSNEAILVHDHPADQAEAIIKLLTNPELRQQMGEHARDFVTNHYSWEGVTRKLTKIIAID